MTLKELEQAFMNNTAVLCVYWAVFAYAYFNGYTTTFHLLLGSFGFVAMLILLGHQYGELSVRVEEVV